MGIERLPCDILRSLHECLDIPTRRQLEAALGWPVIGIRKLPAPHTDLFTLKNKSATPIPGGIMILVYSDPEGEDVIYAEYICMKSWEWEKYGKCKWHRKGEYTNLEIVFISLVLFWEFYIYFIGGWGRNM